MKSELLSQCEEDIRMGRAHLVSRRLSALNFAQLDRKIRLPLAKICDRAGMTALGLKILTPLIQTEKYSVGQVAEATEIAEYAVLLQRIGSTSEALAFLEPLRDFPDAFLYRAFCHFSRWEYGAAVPLLNKYLSGDLEAYPRLIGRVNLAAALVAVAEIHHAAQELDSLISDLRAGNHLRLLGNCLELRAQVFLKERNFPAARDHLDEAQKIFGDEATFDNLFVNKWRAVMQSIETGDGRHIQKFREHAVQRKHWETVRDCDRQLLSVQFSESLFAYLMFGTPYQDYRARAEKELQRTVTSESFLLGSGGPVLDLANGILNDQVCPVSGKKIHQLLEVLTRDFYRPYRLGGIFHALFPEERFNIFSSPDRVHQIFRRARKWLMQAELPIAVLCHANTYSLELRGPVRLELTYNRGAVDQRSLSLQKLKETLPQGELFSTVAASHALAVNAATFQRLAIWALERNLLKRVRIGRSIRYKFTA